MTFSLFAQGNESQQHNYVYVPLPSPLFLYLIQDANA